MECQGSQSVLLRRRLTTLFRRTIYIQRISGRSNEQLAAPIISGFRPPHDTLPIWTKAHACDERKILESCFRPLQHGPATMGNLQPRHGCELAGRALCTVQSLGIPSGTRGHVAAREWPNGRAPNGSKSSISSTLPRSPMRKRPFRSSHFTILYCEKLFSRL
jgi:hypothetical protein